MNEGGAEDFVNRFAEYWRAPTPERLDMVLAPNVRLVAPMTPVTHDLEAGKRAFAELFKLIDGMTAEVHRWGATADGVLIEFTLTGTAGGGPISWNAVDRFVIGDDGLATERVSYFDSLPIVLTAARRPRTWPGFLRSRLRAPALVLALVIAAYVAAPAQAAFPGVPGPIAYPKHILSEATGDSGGIFTHGPRKSQSIHQLTSDGGDNAPSYSANGRTIAFAGNRDLVSSNASHVYLINADGSGVKALTSGDNYDSNPSFSPNGQQVVFDRAVGYSRITHIYIVNVDGSGLRQITNDAGSDSDPTFTPNGRSILFVSNRDTDARSDHSDIFTMKPSGAQLRVLIDGPRDEYEPDVSPNGRRIAFASNRDHGPNIFVAKANGRGARELTHSRHDCFGSACYSNPSWAPDGKHIALLRLGRYSSELEVMRADGKQDKTFADAGRDPEGFGESIGAPAWGPAPR